MQATERKKYIKTISAREIADLVQNCFPRANTYTLTAVLGDGCYLVGIADQYEAGYTDTGLIIDTPVWNDACDIVDAANLILFPTRSKKENAIIQLSTMRLSQ